MPQPLDTKLDSITRVITPENIEFEYALAGPFQRLPAFVFDFIVRVLTYVAVLFVIAILSSWTLFGNAFVVILASLLFFLLSWFYGIYFESRFNGRTPGKMVFRLRAISVDGRPINATQAALRNLLRIADMNVVLSIQLFDPELPPAYIIPTMLVGMVAMTVTHRMQRIGDLAAGTMVISEHRKRSPWNLQPDDLRVFGLAELIPATFQVSSSLAQTVGLYMENRKRLSPLRRQEVARNLGDPLIRKFGLLPDTSSDLLLCALYVRTFMSEEQRGEGLARLRAMTQRTTAGSRIPPGVGPANPSRNDDQASTAGQSPPRIAGEQSNRTSTGGR